MRTVKEINVDIKKLKAELKLAYAAERNDKATKAIACMETQGFNWNGTRWVRPSVDKPLPKPRQFVVHGGKIYLVHESYGIKVTARKVTTVSSIGIMVEPQLVELYSPGLRFVDEQYVRTMFA
ncbi:hypothetical protein FNPHOIGM_00016 [Dickeya phage DchS19]|uniref:Uncharacterized protein n=1 Tax=Dickeya phage DchS19 TaxID=2951194 RepID=A0A9E7LUR7_9CAUD|nr:hypothetical protein FNPHOIGM_00016 [Dickeya phage DchS19]